MSRFFRPELTLAIAGTTAVLQEKIIFRKIRLRETVLPAGDFEERLSVALALLPAESKARLRLFLPSSQFLFWSVPWVSAKLSEADCFDLAATLLQQDFDQPAGDMAFTLSPARFGQSRMACGIARNRLEQVRKLLPQAITLAGVQPLLSLSWSHTQASTMPVLYSEPGFAALLCADDSGLHMHCRRLAHDRLADDSTAASLAGLFGIDTFQKIHVQLKSATSGTPMQVQGVYALDLNALMRAA